MSSHSVYDSPTSSLDDLHEDQSESGIIGLRKQQQLDGENDEHPSADSLDKSVESSSPDAGNTAEENASFRLLDLPPEVRRQILGLVLPQTYIHRWWGPFWKNGNTALLRTCQQLQAEGTSILYSTNTFVIQISLHRCPQFLKRTSQPEHDCSFSILSAFRQQDLQSIRKIDLEVTGFDVDVGLGKYNIMNMGGLALGLQEEVRKLLQTLSQRGAIVRVGTVVWTNRDAQEDMEQHRKTVLSPLRKAGVQIEELRLSAWLIPQRSNVQD